MFGCIAAGRLVQTNPQQVSQAKYLFSLDDALNINHIVIFLTGVTPLPPGFSAAVYFGWPPYKEFKYLGFISNEKPSAIFRLSGLTQEYQNGSIKEVEMKSEENVIAQIGISIERTEIVNQIVAAKEAQAAATTASAVADMVKFSQKMLENLFNYVSSFAKPVAVTAMTPDGPTSVEVIPIDAFKKWYANFEHKLQKDPYFWKDTKSS